MSRPEQSKPAPSVVTTARLLVGIALAITGLATGRLPGADDSARGDTPEAYSLFAYMQKRLATEPPLLDFPKDPAMAPQWKAQVVERLRQVLGLDLLKPAPLNPRLLETRARSGYRVEHIVFSSEAFADVPAYLLIPDGVTAKKPAPAVLCLQGMVPGGKNQMTGETENDPVAAKGAQDFHDDFALQLTRQGFVTLTIDMRYDGERSHHTEPDPLGLNDRGKSNDVAANMLKFMGLNFYGLNLFDAQRGLDYLLTRPEVNPAAVAAAGFSFGSQLSAWLASMDNRVKVVALEGNWVNQRRLAQRSIRDVTDSDRGRLMHQMLRSTFHYVPGFLRYFDLNTTVAAAAPTPMLVIFESGRWQYHNQEEIDADEAPFFKAYAGFGKSENLRLVNVPGPHIWRGELIVPWLSERLRELHARSGAGK